jgi:hypothetical protein
VNECEPLHPGQVEEPEKEATRAPASRGKAAQVDPITPKLKPPVSKILKPEYDKLLSNIAFKSILRRYTMVEMHAASFAAVGVTLEYHEAEPSFQLNLSRFVIQFRK